jgi:hypothetical protein
MYIHSNRSEKSIKYSEMNCFMIADQIIAEQLYVTSEVGK